MTDRNKKIVFYSSIIIVLILILLFIFIDNNESSNNFKGTDNIVFLGDSITYSYDVQGYFPKKQVINSGVWGDRTDNAYDRLKRDVFEYKPKKIFILLGINDVGYARSNDDIANRIKKLIIDINENCSYSKIYLLSVYPINISDFNEWYPPISEKINDIIDDLNIELINMTKLMDTQYIDIAQHLKNDKNELKKEFTVDGIHLTDEAYEVISDVLRRYVK